MSGYYRCDQEAGKADVLSMESVDCKEKEMCLLILLISTKQFFTDNML